MKKISIFSAVFWLFLVTLICFTSCISSKKLHKTKSETDSVFVDKSETSSVVTEKADTIIYTKADTTEFSVPTTDTTSVITDTPTYRIEAKYNKKTKKVDVIAINKSVPVHFSVDKKTVYKQKNNISSKVEKKSEEKHLDKKTFSVPWWIWLILIIITALWVVKKIYFPTLF